MPSKTWGRFPTCRLHKQGSALLTVLWLTAALSAIGLAVANNVRGETERSATNVDDAKSYFIAKGAVERAMLHMFWGPDFYRPGQPTLDFSFPEAQAHVEIIPEASKLGLNSSPPEELVRLLTALGQPEDRAFEITAAIVDWRTPELTPGQSPFDSFYLAQSPSFLPRHSSFLENEELLQMKGVTPDLYYGTSLDGSRAGLRDCLSAYSGGGALDINTARAESMIAIGISPGDAAAIVQNRATHPILDYQELGSIQQQLGLPGARLRIGGGSMFTIRATARIRLQDGKLSDLRRSVAALVKYWYPNNTVGKTPGFEVVRWYDRT
jgi:general secretion pathway protein K